MILRESLTEIAMTAIFATLGLIILGYCYRVIHHDHKEGHR